LHILPGALQQDREGAIGQLWQDQRKPCVTAGMEC